MRLLYLRLSWTGVIGCALLAAAACSQGGPEAAPFAGGPGGGQGAAAGTGGAGGVGHGGQISASGGARGGAHQAGTAEMGNGSAGTGQAGAWCCDGVTPGGAGGQGGAGQGGGGAADNAVAGEAGAAGAAGQGTTAKIQLLDFAIEPNPNMTIACFVSWRTTVPATSLVQFGDDVNTFRIRDDTPVTLHRVLVVGMHAQTPYRITAASESLVGSGNRSGTFTTGALPDGIPTGHVSVKAPLLTQPGWTLTNVQSAGGGPPKIVMYDADGLPVWYFVDGTHDDTRGDVATQFLGDSVLIGPAPGEPAREVSLAGEVLWEGPPQRTAAELQTHCVGKTQAGNYLLNVELDKAVQNQYTRVDDQLIEELSPALDVVWSWRLLDHVPAAGTREELCHGNSLRLDETTGVAYYNCRYEGLLKIDRATGDIRWRLGGSFDTTSLGPGDFTFDPPGSQFYDLHEPEMHADGTVLVYDNDGFAVAAQDAGHHSRIVEYQLDEIAMTATRTFEFPGSFAVDAWYQNDWYTPIWGDADRLPNGNVLVTAGMRTQSQSTRLFEVTRTGQVVWVLELPLGNGSFQADRVSPPPLIERLR